MTNIQNVTASAYGAQSLQPALKAGGKKDPPQLPVGFQSAKVEISDASITVSRLREEIDAIPEVRIKLVEEIKERIRHNDYPIATNLYKALDKMIENKVV